MGVINISASGSFPSSNKRFSAIEHGHARAVADAIKYLSNEMLPAAIRQDHDLQAQGDRPSKNFGKD